MITRDRFLCYVFVENRFPEFLGKMIFQTFSQKAGIFPQLLGGKFCSCFSGVAAVNSKVVTLAPGAGR
jgi:hypothetical protein